MPELTDDILLFILTILKRHGQLRTLANCMQVSGISVLRMQLNLTTCT